LNRARIGLFLPAAVPRARVLDRQLQSRHAPIIERELPDS
jgi:hypothetical protein